MFTVKGYPVLNDSTKNLFIDSALNRPFKIVNDEEENKDNVLYNGLGLMTNLLKPGIFVDLKSISQTDKLKLSETDEINPKSLVIKSVVFTKIIDNKITVIKASGLNVKLDSSSMGDYEKSLIVVNSESYSDPVTGDCIFDHDSKITEIPLSVVFNREQNTLSILTPIAGHKTGIKCLGIELNYNIQNANRSFY